MPSPFTDRPAILRACGTPVSKRSVLACALPLVLCVVACGQNASRPNAPAAEAGAPLDGSTTGSGDSTTHDSSTYASPDAGYGAEGASGSASDASTSAQDAEAGASQDAADTSSSSGPDGGVWLPPSGDGGSAISPYLVGVNYWLGSDLPSLQPLVQQSGVRLIRIGGAGVDADSATRGTYYKSAIQYIRSVGGEPLVQVSDNVQASDAANIVNDLNVVGHLNVKFWSIGNEPDLQSGNLKIVSDVGIYVRSFAQAMRSVDPSIFIFAPDLAWMDTGYFASLLGGADDITGEDANGRHYVDGIAFHTYPLGNNFTRDQVVGAAAGVRLSVQQLKGMIAAADAKNMRTGSSALAWALTEFNITYSNPSNNGPADFAVESFLNGQFFAEVFGVGMAEQAYAVDTWSIHEASGSGSSTDLGYIGDVGNLIGNYRRSSYYHIQMLTQDFGGHYAPSTSSLANVKVLATVDTAHVAVMILNEDNTATYPFSLSLTVGASANIIVDAGVTAQTSGSIGPQATQVLVFDTTGVVKKKTDFSLAGYQAGNAPTTTTF